MFDIGVGPREEERVEGRVTWIVVPVHDVGGTAVFAADLHDQRRPLDAPDLMATDQESVTHFCLHD